MRTRFRDKVARILTEVPETRGSDQKLYIEFLRRYTEITPDSLWDEIENGTAPSMETIGRCRRSVQERDPSLRPSAEKQEARKWAQENWEMFTE